MVDASRRQNRIENDSTGFSGLKVRAGGRGMRTLVAVAPATSISGQRGVDGVPENKCRVTTEQGKNEQNDKDMYSQEL